jgi:hypothetical protein
LGIHSIRVPPGGVLKTKRAIAEVEKTIEKKKGKAVA